MLWQVVVLCSMLYCLPPLWTGYFEHWYARLAPFLLPLVHIALMSSVYSTVVISWERYVRICLISNLITCNHFSGGKFKLYVAFVIAFPILFYVPKFFEVQPMPKSTEIMHAVNCSSMLLSLDVDVEDLHDYTRDCAFAAMADRPAFDEAGGVINVTRVFNFTMVQKTWLRRNVHYYNIYCIGLNIVFATLLPFVALFYLNVSTVLALQKLRQKTLVLSEAESTATATTDVNNFLRRSNSPVCRRRENRLTRISLTIVWLFLFCHMWKLIPTAYEVFVGEIAAGPDWLLHVQHTSHALIVLSSSVNFLIYVAL